MAAPWSVGIRARIIGRISGQLTVNVLHFGSNVPWNVDTIQREQILKNLANAIRDCIMDTLLPAITSDWTFDRVECTAIAPELSDPIFNDDVLAAAGTAAVQGVNMASQLVSIKTGGGGKSGRGRFFLPPGGENHATAGEWDPAALLLVAAFCACMAGKFIGAGATEPYRLGVLSRKIFANAPGNFDEAFREASQLVPESIIATMGTRRKGRGA